MKTNYILQQTAAKTTKNTRRKQKHSMKYICHLGRKSSYK